jgi:hypothetical protein
VKRRRRLAPFATPHLQRLHARRPELRIVIGAHHGEGPKLTDARVTKTYTGDIEGTSITRWLMAYAGDGSATFVGLERIDATIGGHHGSLVVATGTGTFTADPAGKICLDLTFEKRQPFPPGRDGPVDGE